MKKFTKILPAILTAVMLLGIFAVPAVAYADGGEFGNGVTWTLEDGVLTITGVGPMENYLKYNAHSALPQSSRTVYDG